MFQQWDGNKWVKLGDPIEPMHDLTSAMIKEAAAKYAAEKGITPRDCSKEG
jgi:branched-chain amino acid transport system substrate-binding protein